MDKLRLIELSEKYYRGNLNTIESKELQDFIDSSEENKKEFEDNVSFFKNLDNFYAIEQLKRNLIIAAKSFDNSLKERQKKSNLYKLFIQYSSVAAVAIIAVLFTLYVSGWFSYKHQVNAYRQLSNTITTISKNQKSLWNTLFSSNEVTYIRGTAFAISANGLLATSFHLVKDYDSVLVVNASDSSIKMHAKVIAFDEAMDIAILKISDSAFLSLNIPYTINFNYPIELGSYVYSLGFSKNSIVFGEGSISSFTGYNEDSNSVQISIPTNPGNSGSPVFNQYGEIIGIICGKNYEKEGSSFAVRSIVMKQMIDSLLNEFSVKLTTKNTIKHLPKNKQILKILPNIFRVEIY